MGNHELTLFRPGPDGSALIRASVVGYPDWLVEAEVVPTSTGPAIRQLQVRPVAVAGLPTGGVPARLVRKINPGELLDLTRTRASESGEGLSQLAEMGIALEPGHPVTVYMESFSASANALSGQKKRPGRAGNGIDHYLDWAIRYAQRVDAGDRHPIVSLAEEHGKTRQYVRDTITDARRRYGLLPRPGQGKAGGQLTDKARSLIEQRTQAQPEES